MLCNLTKREKEIVKMIVEGKICKQISKELYISNHTARTHIMNIYKKLDCHNRAELFKIYYDLKEKKGCLI